jgi:hypothetical protein
MLWPDPISLIADTVTIIGLPTLAWSTWRLWSDHKKERAEAALQRADDERRRTVSVGCVEFFDVGVGAAVNLVPFERITLLPRQGDVVELPGETQAGQRSGYGSFDVQNVRFSFYEAPEIADQPCPAVPSKVIVHVRRRS